MTDTAHIPTVMVERSWKTKGLPGDVVIRTQGIDTRVGINGTWMSLEEAKAFSLTLLYALESFRDTEKVKS